MMRYLLPDVFVLMIVGAMPDFVQGTIKQNWVLAGRDMPERSLSGLRSTAENAEGHRG